MSIGEQLESASENTTKEGRWFSRAYFLILFGLVIGLFVALFHFNYIALDLTITANPDISWILEVLAGAVAGLFILFSTAMLIKATGGKTIKALFSIIARIADNYELDDNIDNAVNEQVTENVSETQEEKPGN